MAFYAVLALAFLSAPPQAVEAPSQPPSLETQIEALFAPGRDLLDVKLTVDRMVEPSADPDEGRKAVDALAAELLPMAEGIKTSHGKLQVLRRFLYRSGPWNGYRPFSYDMTDTLGKNPVNKLLTHYVRTRLGNCVTMPILAMILGRRMGLKMTLAAAPFHIFVKYTDDDGKLWNLEATSGLGFTRDLWYRKELPMTDQALAKGIYLRPLSEEENAALMATFLIEHEMRAKQPENAIAAAGTILRHNPRDANLYLWRGSAYALILRRDVVARFPDPGSLPPEMRAYADALYYQNQVSFAQAEALGWTEQDGIKPGNGSNE